MMKRLLRVLATVVGLLVLSLPSQAQLRHEIHFPDVPGYKTLKCDFHMHTVFSDGTVWPTVRVDEAWQQGLDAITLTDHIEYQPHKDDLPTNHNRPFDLAAGRARQKNLLFPRAAEITRDTPPGHFNTLFLKDANPLDTADFLEAVKQANEQDAFVFWNHQAWKGPELGKWMDVHTQMYDNKWLHGMEVCNGQTYYPDAHRWCLEKGLTMMGTSDIHGPDQRKSNDPEDHRTMTLVFAKERTLDSLKEALVEGRTVVWYMEQLIGRREFIEPLFVQCIRVAKPHLRSSNAVWVAIENVCDLDVHLERTGSVGPAELELPARTTYLLNIRTKRPADPIEMAYTATNLLIAPEQGLPVTLRIPGE
ncbi:MAG: histidinol-phosphatase [Planctomycetes bacterium]|nr:histidinol-phosphatase [Planctomycetota bacterium]MBL7044009.1 histidinol-phosphatase [Pirellulaceae bacterium]